MQAPVEGVGAIVGKQGQVRVGATEAQVREDAGLLGQFGDLVQEVPQRIVVAEDDAPFQTQRALALLPRMGAALRALAVGPVSGGRHRRRPCQK